MQIQANADLSQYTSFRTGGKAEKLILCESPDDIVGAVTQNEASKIWALGYGTNVLISDDGLPGLCIMCRGGDFQFEDDLVVAEASAWWDDLILAAIEAGLWGAEFMSGIPSSVGAAVTGNIAAYGQQVSDILEWVEAINLNNKQITRLEKSDIKFNYRASSLQNQPELIVLRVALRLNWEPTKNLEYESALSVAKELELEPSSLQNRREIIIETRRRAGSLYDPSDPEREKTDGSFFKNPMVETQLASKIMAYDETGKSIHLLQKMNSLHGGDTRRVSAAHVLLAAGFKRGQTWGAVRLHPKHVLKIENTGTAKSIDIYNAAQEIIGTVREKFGIELEPEVKFLGHF